MSGNAGGGAAAFKGEVAVSDQAALRAAVAAWLAKKKARDYVVVQAYIHPSKENRRHLKSLCEAIQQRLDAATTLGVGPRFLHSTGQLHKGGPNSALVLQLVDRPADNLSVPETNYTFDALIEAQARGDFTALKQRRRRVLRVDLGSDTASGLRLLHDALRA